MSSERGDIREGIWASLRTWRIPSADLSGVLFFFAIYSLFFVWLGLSVFGVEAEAIRAAHRFLPQWFFFANFFLTPVLAAFAAGPLPVPRILRLVLTVVMFCSGSLFVVTPQHQAVGLAMLGFLYLEAFWLIPLWNGWGDRRKGITRDGFIGAERKSKESSKVEWLAYVIIAVVLVGILVVYKLSR